MKNFKDVYAFPLEERHYWVYDANDNFVLQFQIDNEKRKALLLDVINGNSVLSNNEISFHHSDGFITDSNGLEVILIRGWGNLTGVGAMNLPVEEAKNIQDTFAEFIVQQLNKKNTRH